MIDMTLNMKHRNVTKIKKSDLKIPRWAEWEKKGEIKQTIKDKVKFLVSELPSGFMFPTTVIQDKMKKDKQFKTLDIRRTSEALLNLQRDGILYSDPNWHDSDSEYHAFNGQNKVKLYKVV